MLQACFIGSKFQDVNTMAFTHQGCIFVNDQFISWVTRLNELGASVVRMKNNHSVLFEFSFLCLSSLPMHKQAELTCWDPLIDLAPEGQCRCLLELILQLHELLSGPGRFWSCCSGSGWIVLAWSYPWIFVRGVIEIEKDIYIYMHISFLGAKCHEVFSYIYIYIHTPQCRDYTGLSTCTRADVKTFF